MTKNSLLLLALMLLPATDLRSQDGKGRLFEKIFRGIAHAVASENGSLLVPPPIPYDSRVAQPQPSRTTAPRVQAPSNQGWYQPPVAQPQVQHQQRVPSYAERQVQQPRVIRHQSPQVTQPTGPFAGWLQPQQSQPPHQTHQRSVQPQRTVEQRSPFSGFSPFQQTNPHPSHGGHHQGHQDHRSHHQGHGSHVQQGQLLPGLFGQREPSPSYSRGHDEHRHHGHDPRRHHGQRPQEKVEQRSPIIAIRSQFQPFTVFQGQQNQRVISGRTVQTVPNQGSIVWLRTR